MDDLASKFYDQIVIPRRIGSDESPVPAVPQKNGVCASLGEPLLASLLCGIMWVSHSLILYFVYAFVVGLYAACVYSAVSNCTRGVIVVCLNGFIRYRVSLGFNLIQCLAMS